MEKVVLSYMTHEKFEELVTQLQEEAKYAPKMYKLKVLLLTLLGYGYIFLILAAGLAGIGLILYYVLFNNGPTGLSFKFILIIGAVVFLIFRSLWFRMEEPSGLEVTPEKAPALFKEVEQIRKALNGPKIHRVLLTDEFNASIVQHPRFGFFGFYRNYLILGLPLLQALSVDQVRSVIAHEMGHLAGSHGRFAAFIYRIRETWRRLLDNLKLEESWSTFIFKAFFSRYVPYFYAYTFVLARQQEYEADECSAQIAGREVAAASLVSLNLQGQKLSEQFWSGIYKQAETDPMPPKDVYSKMELSLSQPTDPNKAKVWLQNALQVKTDLGDTHPSLNDRISALGLSPQGVRTNYETGSARFFLGESLNEYLELLNEIWFEQQADNWKHQYEHVAESKRKLNELSGKNISDLSFDDAMTRAMLTEQYKTEEEALGVYKEIDQAFPPHAAVKFSIGRVLLGQRNGDGISFIETAMELDEDFVSHGSQMIYAYHVETGQEQKAEDYYERFVKREEFLETAEEERSRIAADCVFMPHELNAQELSNIQDQLRQHPEIKEAYLVQKQVAHFPERPVFLLGYTVRRPWYTLNNERFDNLLLRKLANELHFDYDTYMIHLSWGNFRIRKKIKAIPGSKIYKK
jgi:Zn-dependent protease with chaperone function